MLPIEKYTDGSMRHIANTIESQIGSENKYGFMVLVFPFGEDTRVAHYISNANREDMIKALREKADVLEKKFDISVGGGVQK